MMRIAISHCPGGSRFAARCHHAAAACTGFILVLVSLALGGCSSTGPRTIAPGDHVYEHKVVAGETLEDIADEYYGKPDRSRVLADVNSVDDDALHAGMTIRVPLKSRDIDRLKVRERARVPYNKGLEYASSGSYVDAVPKFQEAIKLDPNFAEAHYNLGVAFQKVKSYDKAMHEYQEAVDHRPDKVAYQFALGTSYFHLNRYDEAARAFEHALEHDPAHMKAQYSLAVAYEKLGDKARAKAAWTRYLELDGTSAWATEARKHLKDLQ
jgi:tetratricopeptide (TPR) repeat protein